MNRKLWLGAALLAALCAAAAAWHFTQLRPAPATPPASASAVATPAPVAATLPAAAPVDETAPPATRPVATYDRYKQEIERGRSARKQAQALQSDERCIGNQRFRKVGAEWQLTGEC